MRINRRRHAWMRIFLVGLLGIAFLLAVCPGSSAQEVKLPKVVQITVCTTPGGGSDAFARFLVRWLPKYIPGNPQFVIKYMPGAGNTMGRNFVYNTAPDDGSVWVITSTGDQLAGLYGWKAVKYDIKKQIPALGLSGGTLLYTKPEIAKNWNQVYEKEILVWGYQPAYASQQDAFALIAQEMLGFKMKKWIFSYGGSGDSRRGFLSGEINFSGTTVSSYPAFDKDLEESGELTMVVQLGDFDDQGNIVRRDPPVGHVPTLYELYKDRHGKEPSGPAMKAYKALIALAGSLDKTICFPPTMDPKIWNAVSAGCERMAKDPEFVADSQKRFPGLSILAGKRLRKIYADEVIGADPEAIQWLKQLVITKAGVVDK
jgi:tripartite-type tricarboxylate transporter receptor subunit TctC